MAQKINYGTRKYINSFRPEKSWQSRTLFLLTGATRNELAELDKDAKIPANQCFCPECNKVNTLSTDISFPKKGLSAPEDPESTWFDINLYEMRYGDYYTPEQTDAPHFEEIVCPECGHTGEIVTLAMQENEDGEISWQTPALLSARGLSKYVGESGKTTRIDDRSILQSVKIHQDGTTEKTDTIVNEVVDLVKNDIYVSTWNQDTDRNPSNQSMLTTVDPYCYPKMPDLSPAIKYGVRRVSDMSFGVVSEENGWLGWNRNITSYFSAMKPITAVMMTEKGYYTSNISNSRVPEMSQYAETVHRAKLTEIEHRFDGMTDSLYIDGKRNGLYLFEHHPGSNEENTAVSSFQMTTVAMMMVRYPCVYLHAAERTERILEDKQYAEIRKQKENPDYQIKTPSDSGRARIFRQEVKHVAEELCAADDNVTKAIKGVLTPKEMRSKLEFFVYGPNGERDIPKTVRLKPDEQTMQDPFKATKALKRAFTQEPLAVASNVYTGLKLGLKTTDHLNQFIAVGNAFSETEPKRARRNGSYVMLNPPAHEVANAGVVAPLRSSDMISFVKRYAKVHNPTDTIQQIYADSIDTKKGDTTTGYGLAIECLRMYSSITSHSKIADQPQEIADNYDDIMKQQMKNYLEQKSLQEAYVDYIDTFKEKTPEIINKYAAMVLRDRQMDDALACYQSEGLTAAKEKHPVLKDMNDPKQALEDWKTNSETVQNLVLTARNGKPLFQNRTLKEIHDELSVMAQKCIGQNRTFSYTEEEKSLEGSYPAPDAEGTWSFHLMKDTNDMLRTATSLHNCVADKSYADSIERKQSLVLYMQDEKAEKVACIELVPAKRIVDQTVYYKAKQFQGDHDNALPERYAGVALEWMKDKGINYAGCSDVSKFGTDASIYGAEDADYHREELDEASGVRRDVSEMKKLQEKRAEMARHYYGLDENGKTAIPPVPNELLALV